MNDAAPVPRFDALARREPLDERSGIYIRELLGRFVYDTRARLEAAKGDPATQLQAMLDVVRAAAVNADGEPLFPSDVDPLEHIPWRLVETIALRALALSGVGVDVPGRGNADAEAPPT